MFHAEWEGRVFATAGGALGAGGFNTPMFRHAIERMDPAHYLNSSATTSTGSPASRRCSSSGGLLTRDELATAACGRSRSRARCSSTPDQPRRRAVESPPRFAVGDAVRVRDVHSPATPAARATCAAGAASSSTSKTGPGSGTRSPPASSEVDEPTYAVRFDRSTSCGATAAEPNNVVHVDLYERYLEPRERTRMPGDNHHDHDHDHDDHHHPAPLSDVERRAGALEELLVEKGYVIRRFIDSVVDAYARDIGPMNGAKVVAHAWIDPLQGTPLTNGTAAIAELGFGGPEGDHIVVVENTPTVHNVVVCTLCSCYPWPVLGLPPNWYKSPPYRSRMVREPRVAPRRDGLPVPDDVEVRVWDSSAEVRYLVLPERPAGSEGRAKKTWSASVTRDGDDRRRHAYERSRRGPTSGRCPGGRAPPPRTASSSSTHRGRAACSARRSVVVESLGVDWDEFRQRLIAAIAADPDRPYYDSWTAALEALVTDFDLATPAGLRSSDASLRRT